MKLEQTKPNNNQKANNSKIRKWNYYYFLINIKKKKIISKFSEKEKRWSRWLYIRWRKWWRFVRRI